MLSTPHMRPASLPFKLSPQRKPFTDIVGLELGAGLAQGVPAVRLRKRGETVELLAAGFLDLPDALPASAEDASTAQSVTWQLPKPFRAPHAALAVTSKLSFLRHSGGTAEDAEKRPSGFRQTSRVTANDLPPLIAGLPDFQAAWAARLLPEGHPPTACSLQISAAAAMSGFSFTPAFTNAPGCIIALLVFPEYTSLAAFQERHLVLYREYPAGTAHIRNAISAEMRIDGALADDVLEDTLVDPLPIIEPVLRPLFRQVEVSVDFLSRRRNCPVSHFFISGLTAGTRYWSAIFSRMLNQALTPCQPLEGLVNAAPAAALPADLNAAAPLLMAAAGAARTVLEDE